MTHSTINIHICRINANVTLSSDNKSDPMIMLVGNYSATKVNIVELNETNSTIVMLHNVTSSRYNITVISIIHPESKADMVEVTANNKTGNVRNLLNAIYIHMYIIM